jgi:membrane-associated protease RseP (regulator of RpoE activity)
MELLGRIFALAITVGAFLAARRVAATWAGVPRAYIPFRRFAVPSKGIPRWARPTVAIAGLPAVYLVASLFCGAAIKMTGVPYYDPTINVTPGGAAELAGIHSGDRVLRVAGRPISTLDDAWEFIHQHRRAGPLEIVLERDATEVSVTVQAIDTHWPQSGQIGITPRSPPRIASIGVGAAVAQGLAEPAQLISNILRVLSGSVVIRPISRASVDSPPPPAAALLRIMGYLSIFVGVLLVSVSSFGWRPSE